MTARPTDTYRAARRNAAREEGAGWYPQFPNPAKVLRIRPARQATHMRPHLLTAHRNYWRRVLLNVKKAFSLRYSWGVEATG